MTFGNKLKALREKHSLSQTELAEKLGISMRTVQNYEASKSLPRTTGIVSKICEIFNLPADYLMNEKEQFVMNAQKNYSYTGKQEAELIISRLGGLFSGGELKDEDKDKVFRAITELYFDSKEKNKKYGRKK